MNQKNLFLVGGGFIAGYVICKMMNPISSSENFSADGERQRGAKKTYNWNGIGTAVVQRGGIFQQVINVPNTPLRLTGKIKVLTQFLKPNGEIDQTKWKVSETGGGVKYVESNLTHSNGSVTSNIWLPALALIQIKQ